MDKLDKFINENASLFDDSEPDDGHFKRFSDKLDQESGVDSNLFKRNLMLKIAAVIIVLITATVLVFDLGMKRFSKSIEMSNAGTGLNTEMQNAMLYYDGLTTNRLGEFNKLACCGEEQIHLNSMVSSELNSLDANISELKKALEQNPDNERVQAALIQNQQMKNQVLDNMISQMKKTKIVRSEK
jgi:hypothetical protein